MKQVFLILAMLLATATTLKAQEVKRVAILEPIDKYDKVDYGVELMVRALITKAVNDTRGFEGYDRTNMSQLIKEHDFQRTGMVNDADIKKFGEMTGASFIVVSEVAAFGSDGRILITSKIIDIETGKIEASAAPRVASIEGNEMEVVCREMFYELLGGDIKSMEIEELSNELREAKMKQKRYMDTIWELEKSLDEMYKKYN